MSKNKSPENHLIRLNKYIADAGIASRRKADELIADGKVQVNGKITYSLGQKIDPNQDIVKIKGKSIKPVQDKMYVMFHKPKGVITSLNDPEGRPSIADYVRKMPIRLFPVGRLDWDTEGLLLLTNDGDFANKVINPQFEVPKTYVAKLSGQPSETELDKLRRGVSIPEGGKVSAKHISKFQGGSKQYDWVKIIISEGKNRQIHHMFNKIGYDVKKLKRVSIGFLKLGALDKGQFKILDDDDLKKIFRKPKNPSKPPLAKPSISVK